MAEAPVALRPRAAPATAGTRDSSDPRWVVSNPAIHRSFAQSRSPPARRIPAPGCACSNSPIVKLRPQNVSDSAWGGEDLMGSSTHFEVHEPVADVMIEVHTFGLGPQQFPIGRLWNSAEAVDRSIPEFQFQKGLLDAIGGAFQRGGIQFDPLHCNLLCCAG